MRSALKLFLPVGAPALLFGVACRSVTPPTEGHFLIFIDTDAPVESEGNRSIFDPMPLLDTVRIELTDASGRLSCTDCARDFALTERRLEEGASFTSRVSATRVHATAWRAETAGSAGDNARIDVWAQLPELPESGERIVTVRLPMDSFGRTTGSADRPSVVTEGPPARPRFLWPSAVRTNCVQPAPNGSVCIPGGAFWMGSPYDVAISLLLAPRVVAMSPYFLDATEVTVAAYREWGDFSGVIESSRMAEGTYLEDYCTFTKRPGPYEDYPVNCVRMEAARAYCKWRGGDLPTEMQYEYAASALSGLPFPWGRDHPRCEDAVLARGPDSFRFSDTPGLFDRACFPANPQSPLEAIGFPSPVHRTDLGRDVFRLEHGVVQDLIGNLAEWVSDSWQSRGGDCWSSSDVRIDPKCVRAGALPTLRGAGWTSAFGNAWVRTEIDQSNPSILISIGFRCAFPGR